MLQRTIAGVSVPAIGLGCMNLNHAYGTPPAEADAIALLHRAFDLGIRHFDTAALYAFGRNESLLGKAFRGHRDRIHLASKCGLTGVDGKRVLDGRPQALIATLDESLARLETDHLDLWYLHRCDPNVPIEDSVGAMARMVEQGKVRAIGLSEVSVATLKRAHAVHAIAAVQTEYSLWTRNPEIAVLGACREIGAAFVAFSPLGRGFLADPALDPAAFVDTDLRRQMPRFQAPHFKRNRGLLPQFTRLAAEAGCTIAQLSLAWLLARADHVIPIPGTTSIVHLEADAATLHLQIDPALLDRAGDLINQGTVSGPRYPEAIQREIGTEEF